MSMRNFWRLRPDRGSWDERRQQEAWNQHAPAAALVHEAQRAFRRSAFGPGACPDQARRAVFATAILWAAAEVVGRPVRVCDVGSGPTAEPWQAVHRLAPTLPVDYHVLDLPAQVAVGRATGSPRVTWHAIDSSDSLSVLERGATWDLVICAGALQCMLDWRQRLQQLLAAVGRGLLTMVPLSGKLTRHVRQSLGLRTARHWIFNATEFAEALAACPVSIEAEFEAAPPFWTRAGHVSFRGYLWRQKGTDALS